MRFMHAADIHLGYQQHGSKDRLNDFSGDHRAGPGAVLSDTSGVCRETESGHRALLLNAAVDLTRSKSELRDCDGLAMGDGENASTRHFEPHRRRALVGKEASR